MSLKQIIKKSEKIKIIATDVDGVLTEGYVFIRDNHEEPFGKFNILDGLAIKLAHAGGLRVVVVSGRKSLATEARCQKLGIDLTYTGVSDKQLKLREIAEETGVLLDEIAYVGDDLIDLPAMVIAGFTCAPANAVYEVKRHVDYVSPVFGGNGVLRDVVELILKAQNKYQAIVAEYLQIK